jgi:ribokinase
MSRKVLNFGSINIDHVYGLDDFVTAGQTVPSTSLSVGLGGKGANQSVALARAGANVAHLGRLSCDDDWAIGELNRAGVDTKCIDLVAEPSGHAIIQLDQNGENAIILHGGANQGFTLPELQATFSQLLPDDFVVMQNECNLLGESFKLAHQHELLIAFNPAPFTPDVLELPLELVNLLIVNEGESQQLSAKQKMSEVEQSLLDRFPNTHIVITLGERGAVALSEGQRFTAHVMADNVVDTTAAGDTFIGFYLAALLREMAIPEALHQACEAAAISVSRMGAISSIPRKEELNS